MPFGKTISLTTLLGDWVPHFSLYGLDDAPADPNRHPEGRKTYYFDMIMWSTLVESAVRPILDEIYEFDDD